MQTVPPSSTRTPASHGVNLRALLSSCFVLQSLNIHKNHVVSVLAPNIPAMYEMHFAVPMAGAVLNTINTRLDAKNIATILRQSSNMPLVIVIDDLDSPTGVRLGDRVRAVDTQWESGIVPVEIHDEWDPIALNYTSGTTSEPKGVVYSHRGAYLSTLSLILGWEMGNEPVYLWSLPMFHCNGWTFTWGVAARVGLTPNRTSAVRFLLPSKSSPVVHPPASLLEKMEHLGFHITHAYGMTEATGPALVCEWQAKNHLSNERKAKLKARQGIVLTLEDGREGHGNHGKRPPRWENHRGNRESYTLTDTSKKDRSKDVIISGGENISSVELESVLYKHPRVLEPQWWQCRTLGGEPLRFHIGAREREWRNGGCEEADIIAYCRKTCRISWFRRSEVSVAASQDFDGKVQKFS
ncbi:hypothetical protein F3Y22_tig00111851pilonHSYRG00044 [Hibiscus syriacus]|uniref:AMP-dependent synthetase/ligase domain-containing protein n=1 Tax=Hibiscus syriacus TaxID=106335 RepID=A0A6A2X9Y3_HIBSY|nr:hypothetical protein F3Y22_tig00111851pilonHSYRG00044 [Hibiscus syriacus]